MPLEIPGANALGFSPGVPLGAAGTAGTAGTAGLAGTSGLNPYAPYPQPTPVPGQQDMMSLMMQMMLMLVQTVLSLALGRSAFALDDGTNGPIPGLPAGAVNNPINIPKTNNAQLDNSLQRIAQDPEGRVLLQRALANGTTLRVGNPGGANVLGLFSQRGNQSEIIVRDGANIKTLVHELVHAATEGDGDSQREEGIANVIGARVADRILGTNSGSPQNIFNRTLPLYENLQRNNAIQQTLAQLGITVNLAA